MPVLNHIGLTVSNLEASIAFYRDVVGLEMLSHGPVRQLGEWFDRLTHNPGTSRTETAHMGIGGIKLQLIQYHESGSEPAALGHGSPGSPHLCVEVDEVIERHADLEAQGYRVGPLVEVPTFGFRSFYVLDPDGLPVELLQRLDPDHARTGKAEHAAAGPPEAVRLA
jgi:catechol 2,3-dioxygenase-like lactoylglutathione lyase family enzyme